MSALKPGFLIGEYAPFTARLRPVMPIDRTGWLSGVIVAIVEQIPTMALFRFAMPGDIVADGAGC